MVSGGPVSSETRFMKSLLCNAYLEEGKSVDKYIHPSIYTLSISSRLALQVSPPTPTPPINKGLLKLCTVSAENELSEILLGPG